ncbi:MAG: DNA repair protein RadC [Gemmatimonadetes bacterium]|nr:DNA repair protein RadC [Gemmatimonadota bacterium]
MKIPIRAWSREDRPRERLRSLGPGALSIRELIAILVGSGGASGSALEVADQLLRRVDLGEGGPRPGASTGPGRNRKPEVRGSLRRLAALPPGILETYPGIGLATASRIVAAMELGRRAAVESGAHDRPVRGPEDVFARVGPLLRDLRQEEFHALLLNTQHRVIRSVLVTRGILDAALIHPREVFRPAVVESAAGVILVHNHPSGDPSPSREDRVVTTQMVAAGSAVGIPVLDHVIIGERTFVSLAERGGMGPPGGREGTT